MMRNQSQRCLVKNTGQANLGVGGCLISVHEPAEAASWIEDNWHNPLLAFIRNSGCGGPFAWMLSPAEPALAIFGSFEDPIVVNMAGSLADLSGFPTVIRPSSDNPALTLLSRETDPQSGFVQFGRAASNNEETRSDGDDEANTSRNENTPGDSGDGRRRDDNLNRAGSNNHGLNAVDEYKQHRGYKGGQKAGDGDGDGDGGGPTLMDGKWESQLHRTRVKLRLKLNDSHTYAVTIGYTFKFAINRETEIPIDFKDITRPLSQSEVIAFVDFKIETRPRETQVDRSYASIGFVAHRRKSIIEREFMHRGFDLPDKLYKHGQHQQIQRGIKAALGFSQGSPLATAAISYNQNNDAILEGTDNKVMPRCRVDYETGDEWDEGKKSYSSYNIAYQLQGMRLDAERSEFYPLEVRVGMGINLHPAGSEKPLPQISFINRNQVLIWISDPTSKTQIRGIVVLMNSYLDNIQTEEKLTINEQEEIDLEAGSLNKPQTKQEQHEPGTISLSIARVQNQSANSSNKFGAAAFIAKLSQRSSAAPPIDTCIPPDEYLARGWDVHNNQWRSVLWPALDKHFRAAALERTSPVWNIRCQWKQARAQQAIATNIQPRNRSTTRCTTRPQPPSMARGTKKDIPDEIKKLVVHLCTNRDLENKPTSGRELPGTSLRTKQSRQLHAAIPTPPCSSPSPRPDPRERVPQSLGRSAAITNQSVTVAGSAARPSWACCPPWLGDEVSPPVGDSPKLSLTSI
ncbi:hypothetical protein B0H14DRAFT_3136436 [Mycena olivaceomarginata]|nr:hypothetical protein B0H14DRAFT_3136436 [Mycena olivaceomarginata]